MNAEILTYLQGITAEERAILEGRLSIDRDLYMQGQSNTINAGKLLAAGKLITIRPHTRFIHFPEHTHDYVEVVYMCSGHTTHIVNGNRICLEQGELLFMNQSATHEVLRAEQGDVAVNFIVLPAFFGAVLRFMERTKRLCGAFSLTASAGRAPGRAFCTSRWRGSSPSRI